MGEAEGELRLTEVDEDANELSAASFTEVGRGEM